MAHAVTGTGFDAGVQVVEFRSLGVGGALQLRTSNAIGVTCR